MKIGILITGHTPEEVKDDLGDYATMFSRLLDGHGFQFDPYYVVDNQFPAGAAAADGWLISGSKHGVYEDHPWIPPLEDLIRQIDALGKPLIGVCFGHQIIAQALGGQVVRHPDGWVAGAQTYHFQDRDLVLNAWHQDQVITPPPRARTLASNPGCAHAVLRYDDHILTVQPHPEFGSAMVSALLAYRAPGVLPEQMIEDTQQRLNSQLDDMAFAQNMAEFFKGAPA